MQPTSPSNRASLSSRDRARLNSGLFVPEVHSPLSSSSKEWRQHCEWCQKLWKRMDRDGSGRIDRRELDCEEFRSVMHRMLAPHAPRSTSYYGRAQINFSQAMQHCMRTADINRDGKLSLEEFQTLMWSLRCPSTLQESSSLLFALFDLDGDQLINREEFRQMYRFYLGSDPTESEFQSTWFEVSEGRPDLTREEYVKWLRKTTNVIFKQHDPLQQRRHSGARGSSSEGRRSPQRQASVREGSLQEINESNHLDRSLRKDRKGGGRRRGAADKIEEQQPPRGGGGGGRARKLDTSHPLARRRASLYSVATRPQWNRNFSPKCANEEIHVPSMRRYFSEPESLMALQRFYASRPAFKKLEGNSPHDVVARAKLAVPARADPPPLRPGHHRKGGRMKDTLSGKVVPWNDFWQDAPEIKYVPTIECRALLRPPPHMWRSRFEYEPEDEPF